MENKDRRAAAGADLCFLGGKEEILNFSGELQASSFFDARNKLLSLSISFMEPIPADETPTIQTEVQVMFFDTDCAAIVHNLAYLRFIEVARTLLAEQLGMGLVKMARSRIYPVLIRTEIDYKRAAQLGDKLVVEGRLESIERSRFWCSFEVRRPSDNTLLVTSRQMLALLQMPEMKPLRLPSDWPVRFSHLKKTAGKK